MKEVRAVAEEKKSNDKKNPQDKARQLKKRKSQFKKVTAKAKDCQYSHLDNNDITT